MGPKDMQVTLPVVLVGEVIAEYNRSQEGQVFDGEPTEKLVAILRPLLADVPPYTHALYFGCIGGPGHYLWGAGGAGRRPLRVRRDGQDRLLGRPRAMGVGHESTAIPLIPWGYDVDGKLVPPHEARQGEAALHHKDGWTAISFVDRSVDTRPGSVSTYLFNTEMPWHLALRAAQCEFPTIWERYEFEVKLRE